MSEGDEVLRLFFLTLPPSQFHWISQHMVTQAFVPDTVTVYQRLLWAPGEPIKKKKKHSFDVLRPT